MKERIRQGWWRFACMMFSFWSSFVMAQQQAPQAPASATNSADRFVNVASSIQNTNRAVALGSLASLGGLLVIVGIAWMIIKILRALTGTKPKLLKPLLLIVIGIALFALPRFLY